MGLTRAEHREFLKLQEKCFTKDGIDPAADKKDLLRMKELAAKVDPEAEESIGQPHPLKIKNFTMSDKGKQLVSEGAEFQGVEARNHGTQQKPAIVFREWYMVGKRGTQARKAIFVQYQEGHSVDGIVIEAGRTIAEAAYKRFANRPKEVVGAA